MQLRRSIAIPFVGILILLIVGTLAASYRISSQSLLSGLEHKEQERLHSIHLNITTIITHQAEEITALAKLATATSKVQTIVTGQGQSVVQSTDFTLNGIDELTSSLLVGSYIQIVNKTGRLLHSSRLDGGATYNDRLWGLAEALAGQPSLVAEKTESEWGLRAFAPIYTAGSVNGVVIVGIPLDNSFANNIATETNTRISLLTWERTVASNIEGALPDDIDTSSAWRSTVLEGGEMVFSHDRVQHKAFLYAPLPLGDETFSLVIQSDSSDLFHLLENEKKHLLTAFGWLSLIVICLGGLTFFLILRPLNHLRYRAVLLGRKYGQSEQERSTGGNEITSLIKTFSLMENAITRHSEELTKSELLRTKLEEENRQAQKTRAIGTLAGGIAHDFNNILTAILGFTELAHTNLPSDSPEKKYLEKVLLASHRARNLTRQILLFGRRSNSGNVSIDLRQTISETSKLIRASLPATIAIVENIDPAAGNVLANPTEMAQVVMNLCTNAQQAMARDGGTLKIILSPLKIAAAEPNQQTGLPAGDYVELTVSDTGCGMDLQTKERILEPYFTTRSQEEGAGLGLAIVHGIVMSCNGEIRIESQIGTGSSFHILLPRHDTIPKVIIPQKHQPATGNEQILFVDDEESIRMYAKVALKPLGYEVSLAANARTALEIFSSNPQTFPLVVSDQTMPGGTGIDLALQLQQVNPDIPIILCSGNTSDIDSAMAQARGVKKIISKPFSAQNLARAIREILDHASGDGTQHNAPNNE